MIRAVLSNRQRSDLLPVSIVFPIASYSETYQKLEAIGVGHIASHDCFVKKLDGDYPVLKRLQETEVNVDELDYLAKRLESFDRYELAQFQGTAVRQEFVNMTDFINLTFCCQGVTVVQDFTDLEDVGRKHYLNLHGGLTTDELQSLNFQEIALSLLQNEDGIITPYGVVYDNGMELELFYRRMVSLCKRAVDMSDQTLMDYVTEAYPIVVFCKQLENKQRRMMEIQECEILPDGTRRYRPLFQYVITENRMEDGKFIIEGHHTQVNAISDSLAKRLLENGMPQAVIESLRGKEAQSA